MIDPGVVERCAAYAALENGDARRALALLRLAAEMAERDHAKRITPDHVVKAKNRLEQDIILECCRTLPPHCKVLLYAILQLFERRRNGVLTGEVYDSYRRLAERLGLQPLHSRSISNYVSELETLGLIRATIVSRGRGGPDPGDHRGCADLGDDARSRGGPADRSGRAAAQPGARRS